LCCDTAEHAYELGQIKLSRKIQKQQGKEVKLGMMFGFGGAKFTVCDSQ